MGDTFRLAMQLTMIDMLSGVASRARASIQQLGAAGKEVAKDFEKMERHATQGLKAIALANFTINKIRPGVSAAADLQESMIDVRMSLMRSGQDAGVLNRELSEVRSTAVALQKITPFSAQDVADTTRELLNAGLEFNSVVAKGGAAWAATALATIAKEDPRLMGKALVTTGSVFGVKGSEYRELADQFQRIGMNSLAKVPDLMEGMKYVGQTAVNMKLSWKDTLAALGTLGEQGQIGSVGGTNLNDFLTRLTGASRITRRVLAGVNQGLKSKGHDPLAFWDKDGKLKSLPSIIKNLRESMSGFDDHHRMFIMEKIFGEQGMRAALGLMKQGLGSWEATNEKMRTAASLEEKMDERLKGFTANVTALGGTTKTTLANLFDPALGVLTALTQKTNDLVDAIGSIAGNHENLTGTFDAMLGIGAAAAGGYGLFNLLKGGFYGAKMLKGLRGLSFVSTGIGIAEGKVVQAATGTTPVFVTNWPGGGFGGSGGGGGGGVSNTVKTIAGDALGISLGNAGVAAAGTVAGATLGQFLGITVVPALFAAAVTTGSVAIGNAVAHWQASQMSWKGLEETQKRNEVMGGGRRKEIDEEMATRYNATRWRDLAGDTSAWNHDIKVEVHFDELGRIITKVKSPWKSQPEIKVDTMPRGDFFSALTQVP